MPFDFDNKKYKQSGQTKAEVQLEKFEAEFERKLKFKNVYNDREIPFSQFKAISGGKLGEGAGGIVHKYKWKPENENVVLKRDISDNGCDTKRELRFLLTLNHRNIVKAYGYTKIDRHQFCLVLECAEGDLSQYIDGDIDMVYKLSFMEDLTTVMRYLHDQTNMIKQT